MKKIFTLLAVAGVALSAAAMPAPKKLNATLQPGSVKQYASLAQIQEDNLLIVSDGVQKVKDKNTGADWKCIAAIAGEWSLVSTDPETGVQTQVTFKEYPFYQGLIAFQQPGQNAVGFFQFYMSWPGYGTLNDDCYNADDTFSIEKAQEIYGAKAGLPMSVEDYNAECAAINYNPRLYCLPSWYNQPSLIGPSAMGNKCTLPNGTECYSGEGYVEQNPNDGLYYWNWSNATYIDWASADTETSEIALELNGKFGVDLAGPFNLTYNGDFEGEATLLGFANTPWNTIQEIHVFNGGRQEYGDTYTWNYDQAFEGALNWYYLAFCDDTFGYWAVSSETNEPIYSYTNNTLPAGISNSSGSVPGSPAYAFVQDYHMSFFAAALWAPENSEFPYGVWELPEITPTLRGEKYYANQKPEAYTLMSALYSDYYAEQDGLHGIFEGYNQYGMSGSAIGIGDKDLGFNFRVKSNMSGAYSIYGNVAENSYYAPDGTQVENALVFHSTPNEWLKFELLPLKSNNEYNVLSSLNSSVKAVETDSPVVSNAYYNFQGQRLNSEPDHGMYIIRSVKADGTVKATKVAK